MRGLCPKSCAIYNLLIPPQLNLAKCINQKHQHLLSPITSQTLPPLHKQDMQTHISRDQKRTADNAQANGILPQREVIEAERGQDRGAGDVDFQAVFVVDEAEVADFVDNQAFEGEVKDRELEGEN